VARKTGSAGLPSAKLLAPENLLRNENDSTLVRVDGLLVNLINNGTEQVLEMQAGVRRFVARVSGGGQFLKSIPFGSRLELTGVYAGQGGNLEIGGDVDSFELLLNSPADIRVLARPAWWTFGRLLALMAALACVLFLALIWISLLHRQVEQRTTQLKQEIHERESAEHRRDLEEERARIARDLHDDLGSSLTEISMLAETGRDQPPAAEDSRNRFDRILGRAHTLVRTLDEIVWAVDPRKDTLPALVHYLAGFAEEYVSAAGLACMVGTPEAIPEESFTAKERHQLFLAVKEALHNSVRHSHANKIIFYIGIAENKLNITITDDGCGFNPSLTAEGNGLTNLHERLVSLRGRCEINSSPEAGTTVSLSLPLSNISHSP
jgi:signal transduction histidine kinase